MKQNLNKNKLNFRKIRSYVIRWSDGPKSYWEWDDKSFMGVRRKRCHRNRKLASQFNICDPWSIPSSWDDDNRSRGNCKSWKDRTKRKHQYKIEKEDNFVDLIYKK